MEEVPWELSVAASHAYRILFWQENLTDDEMPEQWKWPFEDELALHFERVQRMRDEKYGRTSSDDDGGTPMMQNEYAERFHK